MDILALLFPKEKKFYRMVEKQVTLVSYAIADFQSLIGTYEKLSPSRRKKIIADISAKEKQDDELYTEMVRALKSTFITPIDREDLHKLVSTFDMIIDAVETITLKIDIYKIKKINKELKTQAIIIYEAFTLVRKLIFSIRKEKEVEDFCLKIRSLEQKGDEIYIKSLKYIFSDSLSPLAIMKFKDVTSSLERIIDKINESSFIIENIAVKYS